MSDGRDRIDISRYVNGTPSSSHDTTFGLVRKARQDREYKRRGTLTFWEFMLMVVGIVRDHERDPEIRL